MTAVPPELERAIDAERKRLNALLDNDGNNSPYDLQKELEQIMDSNFYVYRRTMAMVSGIKKLQELKAKMTDIYIHDKGRIFNTNFRDAMEIRNMVESWRCCLRRALSHEKRAGARTT